MTIYDRVIGDLPLLKLPRAKVVRLPFDLSLDFAHQLRHNCVRIAWLQSVRSGQCVRTLLDIAVGKACVASSDARGGSADERFMALAMEHAQRENEFWSCFGLFLEEEVRVALHGGRAGPVLRRVLSPERHELGTYPYAEVLEEMLNHYRQTIQTNRLSRETLEFAQQVSGRHDCLDSLPPEVDAYFALGALYRGELEQDVRPDPAVAGAVADRIELEST